MFENNEVRASAAIVSTVGDQRRYERVELSLVVTFTILDEKQAFNRFISMEIRNHRDVFRKSESPQRAARSENLSEGGVKVRGKLEELKDRPILPGTYVDLFIELPALGRAVRAMGVAAWSNVDMELGEFQAGISFVEIDQADVEAIREVVRLLKESRAA